MLQVILASYKEVQDEGGFEWDLSYLKKTWETHMIPFVIFIKGDTVEHDKHCVKCSSRQTPEGCKNAYAVIVFFLLHKVMTHTLIPNLRGSHRK